MRSPLLALLLLACSASPTRPTPPTPRSQLAALAWLRGRWCGPHGDATFCETWRPAPDGSFTGEGAIVVDGARGPGGEALRLEARPDGVFYVATPEGEPTTSFRLTRVTPEEAVFENPEHDFPTRLTYRRRGAEGLVVWVEGPARGLEFQLSRASPPGVDLPPIRSR